MEWSSISSTNLSLHGKLGFIEVIVHAFLILGLGFYFYSTLDPEYKIRKEIPYFYYLHFIQNLKEKIYCFMSPLLIWVVVTDFVLGEFPSYTLYQEKRKRKIEKNT